MFDLKLIDIFSTVFIGVFTLVLGSYFYFLYQKLFIKDKFDKDLFWQTLSEKLKEKYADVSSGFAILTFLIVYILGLFTGDLTDRMTDSDDAKKNLVLKELKYVSILPNREEVRTQTLVHEDGSLTGLGRSIFGSRRLVNNANKALGTAYLPGKDPIDIEWKNLRDNSKGSIQKDKNLNIFIGEIYYTAKNWCYSKDHEPLHELKQLQNQMDLSRSVVLLSALSLQILIAFILIYGCITTYKYLRRKTVVPKYFELKNLFFLISILILARECYNICEFNFNKRAFGYYISNIKDLENNIDLYKELSIGKMNNNAEE